MTEKQLKIFRVVAKNNNISKAAEELYTTQPYLSRQIKTLEDELGVKLFIRKNRSLEITEAGSELLICTEEFFDKKNKIADRVKKAAALSNEKIRIGYMHVMLTGILPDIIHGYTEEHKNVNIFLDSFTSKEIFENLLNESIDIGFSLTFGNEAPENLYVESLNTSKIYIALLKNHPLAKNKSLTLEEIAEENIIFLPHEMYAYTFPDSKNYFEEDSKFFKNFTYAQNMFNAISLVKVGVGITPVAKDFSFHSLEDLAFIPLLGTSNMNFSIAWRKNEESLHTKNLVKYILDESKPILVY